MKKLTATLMVMCMLALLAWKTAPYQIGDLVSDFKLKNVDGNMISLSDYKTVKGVIIVFDCNTCPYSKAYNERILELNKKYAAQGFPVIAINPNDPDLSPGDSFSEMVQIAKEKNYSFPYLVDETQNVARAFGASNTPHVFLLKRESKDFKLAYIGTIDNNARDASAVNKKYVEEAVDALLENKQVPTTRTKAIGCGIKWKN